MSSDPYRAEPGWYPADGDPPGTVRYWDGVQWISEPQWPSQEPPPQGYPAHGWAPQPVAGGWTGPRLASWLQRVAALLIDFALTYGVGIAAVAVTVDSDDTTTSTAELIGFLVFFGLLVAHFMNRIVYQGMTGRTAGKHVVGIQTVTGAGSTPGVLRMLGRSVVRVILANLCYVPTIVDSLWPLWDDEKQRLTDKMIEVHVIEAAGS